MRTILLLMLIIFSFQSFAQQELVQNGSFEQGEVSWDFTGSVDAYGDQGLCDASEGQNYLWFGDFEELTGLDDIDDEVVQDLQLPANLDYAEFSFYWSGGSDEQDDINDYDFLYFGIFDENGDEIYYDSISNADMDVAVTAADCDPLWYLEEFIIPSQYAGQTITIAFGASTDDLNPTLFRVDEVSVLAYTTNGINDNVNNSFAITPNPVEEQLVIQSPNGDNLPYFISDLSGKVLIQTVSSGFVTTVDVSKFAPGIYLVTDEAGAQNKFVKK